MKRAAFTLVELLVVIAIIGLLSTVAVFATTTTRNNAKITKAKADIHQIYKRMEVARSVANAPLITLTGSNCSDCPCRGVGYLPSLASSHACIVSMTAAFAALGMSPLPRDPWGSPYLFDENEMEGGTCANGPDHMFSAGPNGLDESGGGADDWRFYMEPPYYQCR